MRTRRTALASAVAVALALALCSNAAAATTIGNDCSAELVTGEKTLVQLSGEGQLTAPTDGVITSWRVAGIESFGAIPQWLKILRPVGGKSFAVVDEDVGVIKGTTSYQTRIPIQAGDRIGLGSGGAIFYCPGSGGTAGFVNADLLKGSTGEFQDTGIGVPVTATLEPDADGDGWGDETQDQCPRSAEVLVACPALRLDTYAVQTRGYVRVYAAVYGAGKASIAFAGSTKIPAAASDTGRSAKVTWKGSRPGTEGQFTSVRLKFSKNLIDALRRPGVSLPIKIRVTATNVAGLRTTKTLKVRVR